MIKRLIIIALTAGLLSGVGATVFQMAYAVPLILEAEEFEVATEANAPVDGHDEHAAGHGHSHSHGDDAAWAPADGMERTLSTLGANLFAGMGFALLLVAALHLWGGKINARSGLIWGGAGFITFSLAPFFGLPPELPGMVAAELTSRQIWWVATVVMTAGGLALLAINTTYLALPFRVVLGLLLIAAPHALGAPQLASDAHVASAVPAHLSAEFAVVALAHGLLFWLLIGVTTSWLYAKWNNDDLGAVEKLTNA